MARRKQVIQNVAIVDIADKGHAIGRTMDGEVVILLGGTVPGDVVDMRVHRKKKGLKHGYVTEIKSHSSDRVKPQCGHFGTCGGCKWQNLDYGIQASLKERMVQQAIKRIAKDDESKVAPIRQAKNIYQYRNKLEYSFSTKRWLTEEEIGSGEVIEKKSGLGFHIAGAFDKVLQIEKCHLQDDLSNQIRNTLGQLALDNQWSFYDIRNHKGLLRNLMIKNTTLGEWMVTFIFGEEDHDTIQEVCDTMFNTFTQVNSWNYIINTKLNSSTSDLEAFHVRGDTHITEQLGNIKYRISPKSFFQTNSLQAKTLYDIALQYAQIGAKDIVYDLYTGIGSIALYLAQTCASVIGIEVIPEAIEDAKMNAALNGIENTEFLVGDVKDILKPGFTDVHGKPNVLVTDPPRAGMHADVVKTLLEIKCPRLVYISCNPSTQARDILLLKEVYELIAVTPVDMFPHTSHVESVAVLELRQE